MPPFLRDSPPNDPDRGVAIHVPSAPVIRTEHILRIQGYPDTQRVRPAIRERAKAMAVLATELSSPRVAWLRIAIRNLRNGVLEVEGGVRFHCDAFTRVLSGCTEAAVVVLTIGPQLDAQVSKFMHAGELLDALLLESAGWLAIEDATRQFKVYFRETARANGHRITSRMGPGYSYRHDSHVCTWPLEEQLSLFGLFGETALPVTVMESSAMLPKMSRSGLFGIARLTQ